MHLALSQLSTLSTSFADDCRQYAAAGFEHIEIWLTKLERHLEQQGVEATRQLLSEHRLTAAVAAMHGGLLAAGADAAVAAWTSLEQRMSQAQQLGIPMLVVAWDVTEPPTTSVADRLRAAMSRLGELAERFELDIAIEFQANATLGNNLRTMHALLEETSCRRLGICLDVFHFYVGPSMWDDLQAVDPARLMHVQLSDLAGCARELARDRDRILPGDGDLPLQPLLDYLRQIKYDRAVSIELMNPQIHSIDARQVAEIARAALLKLCGHPDSPSGN